MFIDSRQLPPGAVVEADICIVGAGAAGISMAREFIGHSLTVALMEGGGLEFDAKVHELQDGDMLGIEMSPLDVGRARQFGGATELWSGNIRPYAADDFQVRDWIPYSGWPITRADLDPYYPRAYELVELQSTDFDPDHWRDKMPKFFSLPFIGDRLIPAIYHKSPPTRFGSRYRSDFEKTSNVTTYLYANLIGIDTNAAADQVTGMRFSYPDGHTIRVKATVYVLAMGGIENARQLLLANNRKPAGLGNDYDVVGRYFTTHAYVDAGLILLNKPSDIVSTPVAGSGVIQARLITTEAVRREDKLGKFVCQLLPADEEGREDRSVGYTSFRNLYKAAMRGTVPDNFWHHVGNVITDFGSVIDGLQKKFGDVSRISLVTETEIVPKPDSRVVLGDRTDAFGRPLPAVDYRLGPIEKRTLRRSLEIIGEEVGKAGLGRVQLIEWAINDDVDDFPGIDHHHHMGTTRMGTDPRVSVVDADCRVHTVKNLYVAGSSVFTTGSEVQPTVTIIALALRLADHLKQTVPPAGQVKLG